MTDINFNQLRKNIAYSLDNVIKILNNNIEGDGPSKTVIVHVDELQRDLDNLRENVGISLCVFDKENPNFQDCSEDVEASGGIGWFNGD